MRLTKTFRFEASHVLPKHPGKCSRLHGHSWVLAVTIDGPVDAETGFVVDYARLSEAVNNFVIDHVDHQHLGAGELLMSSGKVVPVLGKDFYPSSENLVKAFSRLLAGPIEALRSGVKLVELTLHETCTCAATWRREGAFND